METETRDLSPQAISTRGVIRWAGRVAVSAAMLAVLVWRLPEVSFSDLGPRWSAASPWWLFGAGIVLLVAFALASLRWGAVISAVTTPPPFRSLLNHTLAGQFVSNVLPSAIGGDVIRIARLRHDIGSGSNALASVTVERLTGWAVLPAISLAALAASGGIGDAHAQRIAIGIDAGTIIALGAILLVAALPRFGANPDAVTGWRRPLVAIHLMIVALRSERAVTLRILGVGAAFQVLQCISVWMVAQGVGAREVGLLAAFAFFPPTAIAQNAPIGFGGLGVREAMFVLFFGSIGVERSLAITLGLTVYLITMLVSCAGIPSFLITRRTGHLNSPLEVLDASREDQ